ncbi:hypothetical protein ABEB36_003072 [Hypothenemus hampei]|uniref:Uncharacterized protein n=1 Tax=Hypothenemus hampei TaxID=57062 RepID=A0ABD1F7X8_HYPHA
MSGTDEVLGLLHEIKKEFDRSFSLLNLRILDDDFDIPEDISHIQNLHDIVLQDLEDLKNNLDSHVSIIEKTELIMNILSYKLYEIRHSFRFQIDELKSKKDELMKLGEFEKEDSRLALQLVEIDNEISKLEELQQTNLNSIKEQKLEAQKDYERAVQEMDENFAKMSRGLNKLLVLIEAEKSNISESQAQLVDAKFANEIQQISAEIEKFTALQTTGWKVLYLEEKMSEMLNERGLKILQSGQLIKDDGQAISFQQAKDFKLLDHINSEILNELKANIVSLSDDGSARTTPSSASIGSKMSSADVTYLKDCLGKPLALALAEITALRPKDPIHYLGHWLFKYRYNQQQEDINNMEMDMLIEKRNQVNKERWHQIIEEEAKAAVMDMILRAEEIAIMNELRRIQEETDAMEEMEALNEEARDILGPLLENLPV